MSLIRDNLLRLHFAKSVGETIAKNSIDFQCRALARRLVAECDAASDALQWGSVKVNLKTCNKIMREFSRGAYGNPESNKIDVLRLIGVAIAQLEDAIKGQASAYRRKLIADCLRTMLDINELIDGDLAESDAYVEAASDAGVMETVMEG